MMSLATVSHVLIDEIETLFFLMPHCDSDTSPSLDHVQDVLAERCTVAMGIDWVNQFSGISEAASMILALHLLKQIEVD